MVTKDKNKACGAPEPDRLRRPPGYTGGLLMGESVETTGLTAFMDLTWLPKLSVVGCVMGRKTGRCKMTSSCECGSLGTERRGRKTVSVQGEGAEEEEGGAAVAAVGCGEDQLQLRRKAYTTSLVQWI